MTDLNQGVEKNSEAYRQTTIRTERKHKLALNTCCCCIPLRTGCLILAYFYLVVTIANLILSVISVVSIVMFLVRVHGEPQLIPYIILHVVKLALLLAALPCNILLLIGLHKEKPTFVKTFIIFQLIFTIAYALHFISFVAAAYLYWYMILTELILIGLGVYQLLVMWSQYVKMCDSKNLRQRQIYLEGRPVDITTA